MPLWNPWHGCRRISPGCQHCYVYRIDTMHGRDPLKVEQTADFALPLTRTRNGSYKLDTDEPIYTCLSSDFFLEEADDWRGEAWRMIAARPELHFVIITKRIHRFSVNLPDDWGDGYDNVTICSTCENQDRADYRLPILLQAPIKHRKIVAEPLLGPIDFTPYLESGKIEWVTVGGESGPDARVCDYDWVLAIREQCRRAGVSFHFKQTGAQFQRGNRVYHIARRLQGNQAARAGIDLIF